MTRCPALLQEAMERFDDCRLIAFRHDQLSVRFARERNEAQSNLR